MKQHYGLGLAVALVVIGTGISGCKQEEPPKAEIAAAVQTAHTDVAEAGQDKADNPEADQQTMQEVSAEDQIRRNLTANLPRLSIVSMKESAAPGIYQVEINGGEVIHATADGKYILNGDLLAVQPGGVQNLTETWRSKKRVAALQSLKDEDLVVYPAKGEEKGEVIAFTDTSCGYCQKFHQEIPELNAMGITVKYAAWPRYGLKSPAGQTMLHIWCSDDREKMMTLAKTRQPVPEPEGECNAQVINEQIALGHEIGVRGTPAVYLGDGRKIGGYREAADLAAEMNIAANTAAAPSE
ncbi:MAG: DsbC family protein [Ketobacteraceae bacterium]|nr:DsbC family protein [Ketobacteraceae bacterium]